MGQDDSTTHIGRIEELSFSYVILLPQGHVNFNVNPQEIVNIFGDFGPGQFVQIPNGFLVQNGVVNRLLVQLPKVELKAANQNLLITMLAGCRTHLGNVLMSRSARAFGINNEYFLYFDNAKISPDEFLQRLGSERLTGTIDKKPTGKTISQISIRQKIPVEPKTRTTTVVALDDDNPKRLIFNSNVHIDDPQNPMLAEGDLRNELDRAKKARIAFLTELTTCVTLQN